MFALHINRPLGAAALLAILVLLAGCSSLPFFSEKEDPDVAATEPGAGDAVQYRVEIEAPGALRKLLSTHLDINRFRSAPASQGLSAVELDRLIALAPAQARKLLETEGYFNATVDVSRVGDDAGLPKVQVRVTPGPRTTVRAVELDATGELKTTAQQGDRDAETTLRGMRPEWPLKVGEPFRQPDWTSAKNGTLARLRAQGYANATWASTEARVDARDQTARLSGVAESGPLYHLGPMRVEGLQRYPESAVRNMATFGIGTPYRERLLLDVEERLLTTNLFDGAAVEIDPDPANAAATPVTVRVTERKLQNATLGLGYRTDTGPRFTLEHTHRKPFGLPWIAYNSFELGTQRSLWNAELTSYPRPNLYRNFIATTAERLEQDDELRTSGRIQVGRMRNAPTIDRRYYLELSQARIRTPVTVDDSSALSGNYNWVWRRVDSLLLPTDGVTLAIESAGGYSRSSTKESGPFGRLYGRAFYYRPLGGQWRARLRLEAGQVFAKEQVGVPDILLFRAGGDESVRGYAYRSLGPEIAGVVTSGRSLLTGSAEVTHPVYSGLPALRGALFVDAGNAARNFGEIRPVVGVGTGLHYDSPVGPLRVDLAYGVDDRRVRLHLSAGVVF